MNNEQIIIKQERKQYPVIDILKIVASFFVIMIHSDPFVGMANIKLRDLLMVLFSARGISRLAVPFFFVCTGFFLFKKINADKQNSAKYVYLYIKRILILYLLWIVINLPMIIQNRFINNQYSFIVNAGIFVRELVVGNLFNVSWFLLACIYCVLIVYFLSKLKIRCIPWIIASIFFVLELLLSCYAIVANGFFVKIAKKMESMGLGVWYVPILSSMLFVLIGKYIADNENRITTKMSIIGFLITFSIYIVESLLTHFIIPTVPGATSDAYIMLPFVVYFGFNLAIKIDVKNRPIYADLRGMSTIIYLSHYEILAYMRAINWNGNYFLLYLTIACTATLIAFIIVKLSKNIKILKYLY